MSDTRFNYIDKSEVLEKGIIKFPSIYIEGAAASGKSVAVKMLIEKQHEIKVREIDMAEVCPDFKERLSNILKEMESKAIWVVFENINRRLTHDESNTIKDFIRKMPADGKSILVSREKPDDIILDLFWKREMEIIPQEMFCLDRKDIRTLIEREGSTLKAQEVYEQTGGWNGCVEVMIRLSKMHSGDAELIRRRYEVESYINHAIMKNLSEEEKVIMVIGNVCPWFSEELCHDIFKMEDPETVIKNLERKGFIHSHGSRKRWHLKRLFRSKHRMDEQNCNWIELGQWYESKGHVREAIYCFRNSGNEEIYKDCLIKHYADIPFLNIDYSDVAAWEEHCPEIIYLKGMFCYERQDMDGFYKAIDSLQRVKTADSHAEQLKNEIYLNMMFANPDISLKDWMALAEDERTFRLYNVLGNGCTYLCGLRDLSGLFACTKKEENQNARFWKEHFGADEWRCYCLARMDYYLETKREKTIKDEDRALLKEIAQSDAEKWQLRLAALYLYCKWYTVLEDSHIKETIANLEKVLSEEDNNICVRNAETIVRLYSSWLGEHDQFVKWMKHADKFESEDVSECNYFEMFGRAKGYLLFNQFDKAEKIIQKVADFLQSHKKNFLYADTLFQMALMNWHKERRGQAIKNCIESFMLNGANRYVGIYTRYGEKGYELLKAYVEWHKSIYPEGWYQKKKYNYGNVLHMPESDYLDTVLSMAKRENKQHAELMRQVAGERLTITEVIILQALSRGLSNTDICEEQNLKMSTVKSHIYSIYRKLGVSNRVQAVNRGKEKGIVK